MKSRPFERSGTRPVRLGRMSECGACPRAGPAVGSCKPPLQLPLAPRRPQTGFGQADLAVGQPQAPLTLHSGPVWGRSASERSRWGVDQEPHDGAAEPKPPRKGQLRGLAHPKVRDAKLGWAAHMYMSSDPLDMLHFLMRNAPCEGREMGKNEQPAHQNKTASPSSHSTTNAAQLAAPFAPRTLHTMKLRHQAWGLSNTPHVPHTVN